MNNYTFNMASSMLEDFNPTVISGVITDVIGLLIESSGPAASIGDLCTITNANAFIGKAEVVGFKKEKTLLMPLGNMEGIHPGYTVTNTKKPLNVKISNALCGRILNGLGEPIDSKGPLPQELLRPIYSDTPNPLTRKRVTEPIETGVRAIDTMLTIGKGQRMGIFSGSGVGKSVLMGMMAKNSNSDVNVIALIGERGREVREFIERDLGEEGLKRSVVVVATSDQPALIRVKAGMVAATIAEYYRDSGKDVLFMCDSLTRISMAQREIGLAIGEPPATKGYTPSVFSMMPKFLERAGNSEHGTITGLFTVLVEGDDLDEPIADAARGILDGHIVLSRDLANKNHFPAVDVLKSISRCQSDVVSSSIQEAVGTIKNMMSIYKDNEDLIQIGAYQLGSNPKVDTAIDLNDPLNNFLKQGRDEKSSWEKNNEFLLKIFDAIKGSVL